MVEGRGKVGFAPGGLVGDRYRLIGQIGEGAMGVVWSAVDTATRSAVALKLMVRSEAELGYRLLREARACRAVRHENIVRILEVGETEAGEPFLVMELLQGETLAELLLRCRRLAPREAAGIGKDIALALAAAHEQGIIHRDLKPANVLLHLPPGSVAPVVKVLDFGVSKSLEAPDGLRTALGGVVGSPMYMSPEQMLADPDIDIRADLWSLGVVLYEMLTGERPFKGEAPEVRRQILEGKVPTVSSRIRRIDPDLDGIVSGCLTRSREKRLGPASEIARRLAAHAVPGSAGVGEARERLPSIAEEGLGEPMPMEAPAREGAPREVPSREESRRGVPSREVPSKEVPSREESRREVPSREESRREESRREGAPGEGVLPRRLPVELASTSTAALMTSEHGSLGAQRSVAAEPPRKSPRRLSRTDRLQGLAAMLTFAATVAGTMLWLARPGRSVSIVRPSSHAVQVAPASQDSLAPAVSVPIAPAPAASAPAVSVPGLTTISPSVSGAPGVGSSGGGGGEGSGKKPPGVPSGIAVARPVAASHVARPATRSVSKRVCEVFPPCPPKQVP